MLTHAGIWVSIDSLAEQQGLSPSSLARQAGLDPTTFNPSKRRNAQGRPRWPSTESIAKVLLATGVKVDDFIRLAEPPRRQAGSVPVRALKGPAKGWFTPTGQTSAEGWAEFAFPGVLEPPCFALEIRGEQFLPVYRDGDTLIIRPEKEPRHGDRVFIVDRAGFTGIVVFDRKTPTQIQFTTLAGEALAPHAANALIVLGCIVWASQ